MERETLAERRERAMALEIMGSDGKTPLRHNDPQPDNAQRVKEGPGPSCSLTSLVSPTAWLTMQSITNWSLHQIPC